MYPLKAKSKDEVILQNHELLRRREENNETLSTSALYMAGVY